MPFYLEGEKCHTEGVLSEWLGNKKAERLTVSDKTFGNVPFTDLTSNQFIEGMGKIFELEPFIKIHSISTNRASEKFIQEIAVANL